MKPLLHTQRPVMKRLGLLVAALMPVVSLASEAPAGGHHETMPADSKVHYPWPGGVDPRPYLLSIGRVTNAADQLLLKWSGLAGPYKVQQRGDVASGNWETIGGPTSDQSATIPAGAGNGFMRIEGPRPDYIGASVCRGCHPTPHDGWAATAHEEAFTTLKRIGQGANATCLPCHTVGYGLPGGFVSEAATPRLAGVQCENCHGPAGNHVSDPGNLNVRPVVSMAGTTCGGCHTDYHHPTFDEWLTSPHLEVNEEFKGTFMSTNIVTAQARMRACGSCHSGSVRLAMLEGADKNPGALPPMPSGDVAFHTGITCGVCHDAHGKTEVVVSLVGTNGLQSVTNTAPGQLRNLVYSQNFFSYYTSTNTDFAKQYLATNALGETIGGRVTQLCGNCHNQRGAVWDGSSRPPHYSPQYNMLIGKIDTDKPIKDIGLPTGLDLAKMDNSTHREIPNQCTTCHAHRHGEDSPTEEDPVYTGHTFAAIPENCVDCHTVEEAEAFISFTQRDTKAKIKELKSLLDKWGETKSPPELRAKYGKASWEFSSVGQLTRPPGSPPVPTPTAAEQSKIVNDVKVARYLLYMVEHDASYGVHNGRFTRDILAEGKKLVDLLLAAP